MQIQLNTDNHILGSEALQAKVEKVLHRQLKHLTDELTRIEVHLNDENSRKNGGADKRCLLEARIPGMPPVSIEYHADTVDLALNGAAVQLGSALKTSLGKSRSTSRESIKFADQGQEDLE